MTTTKTVLKFFAAITLVGFGLAISPAIASAHSGHDQGVSCWISASPSPVSEGGSTTLSWGANNADSGWISDIGDVNVSGSRTISNIHRDTTFTFTVRNNNDTATCSTTVYVTSSGSGTSPSCSIYPAQNNVWGGQGVTLNWDSWNASSANLTNVGSVQTKGSYTVYPTYTTTYTLYVYGNGKTGQCQTTVYIGGNAGYHPVPSCTISISNYRYNAGYDRTAQLTWSSQNATNAHISPNIGSVAVNGAYTVSYPNENAMYTLTVSGPGGTATCSTQYGSYGYPYYQYPQYPTYPQYPYVTLTQIPYTGIDLGVVGTTVYFLAMALFALAGAYLLAYYRGGILRFSFAKEVAAAARNQARTIRSLISR